MHREAIRFGTIHGKNGCTVLFPSGIFQLRVRRPPRSRKISGPDVHDAHLLVRDPRSLRDDRTPDHSGIPDDLIGLPADMELKLDHFYRILASDGLGKADLNLFSAFIDHECHKF